MISSFDPSRHGFGFRNPVGRGGTRFGSLVYGRGICFGMVVGSLGGYLHDRETTSLRQTPELLGLLRRMHLSQFRIAAVAKVVSDWISDRRISPHDITLPHEGHPHIICFGPRRSRRLFANLGGSHAVVPYRIERKNDETRVYVYDPNYPKRRDRFIEFDAEGFRYGGFSTAGGWSIYLLPFSVVSPRPVASGL